MKILCAIIVIFSMLPNALAEETLNEQEQQDEFQLILKKSVDINKQNIDSLNNAKKNVDRIIEYHKALNANQKKLYNLKKKYYESDFNKYNEASKDGADFIEGLIGSYPNYFVDVSERDLPDFIDLLAHFDNGPASLQRLAKYGINRADERFWDAYDWFQKRFLEDEPLHGGLFDLNRYYYLAR